jgi:hypothetical protein
LRDADGRVLVHCHAGCAQADVIAGLRARGLWPERVQREWTAAERRVWARERRELESALPASRLWRRAVVALAEERLVMLKGALFAPDMPAPDLGELQRLTRALAAWEHLEGGALVSAYREFRQRDARLAEAMVHWARDREKAERRAVERYLEVIDAETPAP